jgi:carboxyl-terminal processing protease
MSMKRPTRIATLLLALLLPPGLIAAAPGGLADPSAGALVTEAHITRLTAELLESSQFAHRQLDESLASALLDRYLEALDGDRSLFLQSDVAAFSAAGATLAIDTRRGGDTRLAHAIFARYLERLGQRVAFVTDALQQARFDFTSDDSYELDREHAARPRDLAQARELWQQRLRFEYLQEKLDDKPPEQIAERLARRAERLLQVMRQTGRSAVLEIYLSALANVYDPHSDYLGHEQMQEFAIGMNLSLFGIGARLQTEDGHTKLVDLLPGGPAERSGQLEPGDRIVAVAQGGEEPVDVVDLPLSKTVQLIRGPKGSAVELTVVPVSAGDTAQRKTVKLVRDEIKLEERRAKARIIDQPHDRGETLRLGVIELPSFYSDMSSSRGPDDRRSATPTSATEDVARLLEKLRAEDVQGVILDLRRNGGGSLEEAIDLTGLFISQGPVVQTRGPRGDIDIGRDTDPSVIYDGPLVVLTSRFSASASEIVAGALQDYGRALIVGDSSTFGKGTVQSVVPLAPIMGRMGLPTSYDPGALTLTIRKFYRPSGASTQLEGVVPDIVLPSANSALEVGESALTNPLPWDTVSPASYPKLQHVHGYLPALRTESARRVASGDDFAYLRAEIARVAQRLETRTVSLNEAERRRELVDIERRKAELEQAVRASGAPAATTYELTVAHASRPGLPPPLTGERAAASPAGDDSQQAGSDQQPQRDVILREAERILADYVTLHGQIAGWRRAQARTAPGSRVP